MTRLQLGIKRIFDLVLASVLLVVLLIPLVVLTGFVHVGSPGPTFIKQERTGKASKTFTIYKFRTTHCGAGVSPDFPRAQDITWFGRWGCALGLDELPQFINVWRGHMSLIGGFRPVLSTAHPIRFGPEADEITVMRPGWLSTYALLHHSKYQGSFEAPLPEAYDPFIVNLALAYQNGWWLGRDGKILAQTVLTVFRVVSRKFVRT